MDHIYPLNSSVDREAERIACLHGLGLLYSDPSESFDRICATALELFGTPMAAITLVDRHEVFLKARIGIPASCIPRDVALCTHTIQSEGILSVEDLVRDGRFAKNPLVAGAPYLRAYFGAPIIYRPGIRLGAVCVLDTKPRSFGPADRRLLAHFASSVVTELRLLATLRELRRRIADEVVLPPPPPPARSVEMA